MSGSDKDTPSSDKSLDRFLERAIAAAKRGDLKDAEKWYKRAAKAGSPSGISGIAYVYQCEGDLESAETWYRRAAEAGDTIAMGNLATILMDRGELEEAEQLYRDAVALRSATAMQGLGDLLSRKGNFSEAEDCYRRALKAGIVQATGGLAITFEKRGDLPTAEHWYRLAVDAGDTAAMDNYGHLLQLRNDLTGAEELFLRAIEGGRTSASECLDLVRRKLKSADRQLNAVSFDTFGWSLYVNDDSVRSWRTEGASLAERFIEIAPDLPSLDVEDIRENLIATEGLLRSRSISVKDLDPTMRLGKHLALDASPEQTTLLGVATHDIASAKCVQVIQRDRARGSVLYVARLMLLFAECWWLLQLELHEDEDVGVREAAVITRVLDDALPRDLLNVTFDPYDAKWDGLVPVEHDPLTRIRLLMDQLRRSVQLSPELRDLDPFSPFEE